ncbi:NAD(P)(+) transhydrogenase (Re/Si-specific) subunit beta [Olivibacter sp. SDN3]|uniref:NAD(P)(+) transhydrogenase (Re/Si-specific) subunit beta n=1 Tax=Olivibacter sp. SDN3 TaxID=2764720 RepID=UPI00165155AD|nr:NAD(P)(+) transhydrogenase (Re/Si-specific) subunit beta [Olivibacter sp. SDN3]QNL48848.1 NAD(P)(+) transhydrogenase (Re/Si-specific) subunit beta [Olivibacter sp. SDN3]
MDNTLLIRTAYLIAAVLFIVGIKMLGKTPTARRGNTLSATAMLIAILATLLDTQILRFSEIFVTILVASAIGVYAARKVEMTSMPEMIALLNGFGGLASALVSTSEYWRMTQETGIGINTVIGISITLSILIGAVTFTGSMVAFSKLKGIMSGKAIVFSGQHYINLMLLIAAIVFSILLIINPSAQIWVISILTTALVLGVLAVIPIGGADMPVVIALLNSYTGIAAAATGFVLNNKALIITGAIVGTAGLILTQIMCKAMNRSLVNVVLGGFGQTTGSGDNGGEDIVVKEVGVEESAMLFDSVSSVIIVPGYGMAVAQAQHAVRELSELLEKRNISVKFAIHPVAGRMPGHMNVLLAEANIPYDKLIEMDHINDEFATTDIALIIGANDVVNPAAKTNSESPIFGMPVLNVENAQTVIVCKRSMNAGYAGIENELFGYPNCLMLFGDAKSSITAVINELKEM